MAADIIQLDHRHLHGRHRPPDPKKRSTPGADRGASKHILTGKLEPSKSKPPLRSPQLTIRRRFHCGRSGWAVEVSDDVVGNFVLAHFRHRATADAVAVERAVTLGLQVRP